jgi:hypothetical protein
MDETGLFYRALPDRTLKICGEECKGGKSSKERLTIKLCCNLAGDFEKPVVIGKAKTPRCLRSVSALPVTWKCNKKAWMTSELFNEWLTAFNGKMRSQGK